MLYLLRNKYMKLNKIEKNTRSVFHALHSEQAVDKKIFDRLVGLLSPAYLQVPKDFFKNKECLDAGCGSNANATFSMLSHGAKKVCAFDLDESILAVAPRMLRPYEGKYELKTGSVLDIPYADESFDFVHCAGVLHHSTDVYAGLSELARVTKRGGTLFINVHGKGGVMRDFMTTLRDKYAKDKQFKRFVDTFTEEDLVEMWDFIVSSMVAHQDTLGRQVPKALVKELFNRDLVLTIKDRIMAPLYTQSTEKELVDWLRKHGFTKIQRISRYPKLHNIRRFLAPLYYQYDNRFSRLLYGEGEPQIIAVKK